MGIMSSVYQDIEELISVGYNDEDIARSVGMDLKLIKYVIEYIRKNQDRKPK